jgi:hypothetical protein
MEITFGSSKFLKIYTNKTHCDKIIHVLVEINNHIVEGLIDIETLLSIMSIMSRIRQKYNLKKNEVVK